MRYGFLAQSSQQAPGANLPLTVFWVSLEKFTRWDKEPD